MGIMNKTVRANTCRIFLHRAADSHPVRQRRHRPGVLAELRRLGLRVPGDVSVMGYDDLPLAAGCEPPLTTIRQDRLALGKSAFSLLDSLMNGVAVSKVLLRPQLIVRESTGPAPVRK